MPNMYNTSKKLFLIDASGAILSAFLLGVVLVRFETIFGIPSATLYFLAAIPIGFAIYDLYCYRQGEQIGKFLKGIAMANLSYCILSIGLAFYHFEVVTTLGWLYIIGEVLIVIVLSVIEYNVARRLDS